MLGHCRAKPNTIRYTKEARTKVVSSGINLNETSSPPTKDRPAVALQATPCLFHRKNYRPVRMSSRNGHRRAKKREAILALRLDSIRRPWHCHFIRLSRYLGLLNVPSPCSVKPRAYSTIGPHQNLSVSSARGSITRGAATKTSSAWHAESTNIPTYVYLDSGHTCNIAYVGDQEQVAH
jgi:hypothetical protein